MLRPAMAGEPATDRDGQIGEIFRNMRSVMKVSRETIARRLATTPSTIDSFEAGAIASLPRWQETARIIRGYCELLRMNPDPILFRIRERLSATSTQASPVGLGQPRPPIGKPEDWPRRSAVPVAGDDAPGSRRRGRRRTRYALLTCGLPAALAASVAILTLVAPGPIYATAGLLPGVAGSAAYAALDRVLMLAAPRREGLTWIEVGDPRLRKADKLPTSRP